MALQAQLGRRVANVLSEAQSVRNLSTKEVFAVEAECEKLIEELPPIFRVKKPDTSLDEQHPYFIFQRHQMHCVMFVTMVDFLKPYLTRDRQDKLPETDDEFRKMGVDIALRLLRVSRNLFDHEFPINAKFHMVVFSIFDTATLLCSAIIHDRDHVFPHREEVLNAIENSLDMLHQLSLTTKLGASSYNFLHKLVQASPELSRRGIKKQQKQKPSIAPTPRSISPPTSLSPAVAAPADFPCQSILAIGDPIPNLSTSNDLFFDLDHFLGNATQLDMGGMEQIWDWEDLHLDGFSQLGPVA